MAEAARRERVNVRVRLPLGLKIFHETFYIK